MTDKVGETNLTETEAYLKQRAAAQALVIEESMNAKLGYSMKASGMINPVRATRTQSNYDIHNW